MPTGLYEQTRLHWGHHVFSKIRRHQVCAQIEFHADCIGGRGGDSAKQAAGAQRGARPLARRRRRSRGRHGR